MAPLLKYCLLAVAVVLLFCMQVITAEVLCCVYLLLSYSSTLHLQGGPEKEKKKKEKLTLLKVCIFQRN